MRHKTVRRGLCWAPGAAQGSAAQVLGGMQSCLKKEENSWWLGQKSQFSFSFLKSDTHGWHCTHCVMKPSSCDPALPGIPPWESLWSLIPQRVMPRAVCHVPALVLHWNSKHRQHHRVSTVGVIWELCFNGFVKNRDLPGLCGPCWCAGAPFFLLTGKMRDLWGSGAVLHTVKSAHLPSQLLCCGENGDFIPEQ